MSFDVAIDPSPRLIESGAGTCTFDRACADAFFDVNSHRQGRKGRFNTIILGSNAAPSSRAEFLARGGVALALHDR